MNFETSFSKIILMGEKMHLITSLTSLSTLLNVVYQYVTGAFTVSGNKTVNA